MRFNQYSYINFPKENILSELKNVALIYKIQPITKTHLKPFYVVSFHLSRHQLPTFHPSS